MRILILGAGGVGGYLGGRLIEAGADVRFLVRPGRAERLSRDGLTLRSQLGDWRGPVALWREDETVDLIILACKAYDLAPALEAIAPAVRDGVAILPLLNGLAHLDAIQARFPGAALWGGVAHIGATLDDDGAVRHLNASNTFRFGAPGAVDPRADLLAAALATSPVEAVHSAEILPDMWEKLVFLATLAGATCLMRASIGEIVAADGGESLLLGLLGECESVARAEGVAPRAERLSAYRRQLTEHGSPMTASMLRDIERDRPTEGDHIVGDLLDRADRHSFETPLLALCRTHLQAYEARRGGRTA